MKELDLFKDWTPEMIEYLKRLARYNSGFSGRVHSKEARRKISEANAGSRNGMFGKTHSEETRKRMSEALIGRVVSGETKKKLSKALMGHPVSGETKKKISRSLLGRILGPRSPETKKRISETKMGRPVSGETRRRMSEAHLGRPSGMLGKTRSEETRRRISRTLRESWNSLTREEKDKICSRIVSTLHIRPNEVEKAVDRYLQKKYPSEWAYNGDYSQGITIGRKIPDFVNMNGKKEVIEVLGCFGLYHFLDDEKVLIEHYANYGYKCRIIWEWDVWDPVEMERILG